MRNNSLQRWWTRAFAGLLCLAVVTGILALVVTHRLVVDIEATAAEADRETKIVGELRDVVREQSEHAHAAIDYPEQFVDDYRTDDRRARRLFADAARILDSLHDASLAAVRSHWEDLRRPLRTIDAVTLPPDVVFELHAGVATTSTPLMKALTTLDEEVRDEMAGELSESRRAERQLLAGLAVLVVIGVVATAYLGRRLRIGVIEPLRELSEAAQALGDGDHDHRPTVAGQGEIAELTATFRAMADAVAAQHGRLADEAYRDSLTGLANRRSFVRELQGAAADEPSYGIIFADLDDFKTVNDSLGHIAGDELLQLAAKRIGDAVRAEDVVSRLGGDEFAVLLAGPVSRETSLAIAERILASLRQPFALTDGIAHIGASIGLALHDPSVGTADVVMRDADTVMHVAKIRGKNRIEFYGAAERARALAEDVTPDR